MFYAFLLFDSAAISVLQTVNSTSIKLMVDLFHLQLIRGDITNTLQSVKEYIGHVQVK